MKKIIKLGVILFITASIAAGLLAFLNEQTKDIIAMQQKEKNNLARQEVLPSGKEFNKLEKAISSTDPRVDVEEIFKGLDGEEVVGYTIKTVTSGYSGAIVVMTGINIDGEIEGVKVVSNTETPGLGANAATDEFEGQYKGKTTDSEIEVVKSPPTENQIQALTGATITSAAVTDCVNEAREAYKSLLNE